MFSHLSVLLLVLCSALPLSAFQLPENSSQCLLGVADGWNSSHVTLTLFEKKSATWAAIAAPWPGRLGKNGLVWGLGLHPLPAGVSTKKEGDLRSPAGVFDLGGAWGYATSIKKHPKLPYRQVTPRDLWVEDPASPNYNQNVILDRDPASPWEKKQQMKQTDPVHSLKLFIAHNAAPKIISGAGSSIFFHIWRGGGSKPTAGCTTMDEGKLKWLVSKIDPTRRPVFILLPKAEYETLRGKWKLP